MSVQENARLARDSLVKADAWFAKGDIIKGCDEIFQAAAYAVTAAATQRGWDIDETHHSIHINANRLAEELQEPRLSEQFGIAQKLFSNFIHDEILMEDYEICRDRQAVQLFVARLLELLSQ